MKFRGKIRWATIGAVLGAVGDTVVQSLPDVAAGALGGAGNRLAAGDVDPVSIGTGAAAGAVLGLAARIALKRRAARNRPVPQDPPWDYPDGGER